MDNYISNMAHNLTPFFILIIFVICIYFLWENRQVFKTIILSIDKRTWFFLLLIFLTALLIRILIPPHQHIMYIDEAWYMEAGKNILQTGSQGYYPKSIGWPFLLSFIFLIFGINNWVAIYSSLVLGALTVIPVFLMVYIISGKKEMGLFSALVFTLFPVHIRWSTSAETNVVSAFFIAFSIFFCFLYYRRQSISLLWLSLFGLAFACQFRPENYILLPLFLFGMFLYDKTIYKNMWHRLILPLLVFFIISFPNLIQVLDFYTYENFGVVKNSTALASNWNINNLLDNSRSYGSALFSSKNQPIVFTFFIALGFAYGIIRRRKVFLFLSVWFTFNWLVHFYSWPALFSTNRLLINFYLITVIFAAYGIFFLTEQLFSQLKLIWIKKMSFFILAAINIFFFIPYVKGAAHIYNESSHLLETKIPELAEKDIPTGCLVISQRPEVLRSTTNMQVISIYDFIKLSEQGKFVWKECVLFFEDIFCLDFKHSPRKEEQCLTIKNNYNLELYKKYQEKDKIYSFYIIKQKSSK